MGDEGWIFNAVVTHSRMKRTTDTDIECGDCSMVEANWISVIIRCPNTGRAISLPPRFECGTLKLKIRTQLKRGQLQFS